MGNSKKQSQKLPQGSQKQEEKQPPSQGAAPADSAFPIVGIGASAGGLEAFERFLTHLPPNSGMAFVIVQHLDPTHESILADLLKKFTQMQVKQVKNDTHVKPNCVYVIPPNADMIFRNGKLYLAKQTTPRGLRLPIDPFFRSLATDQGDKAICVILSGTGTDGTLGLRAIKEAGGLTIVQTPESARYDGMSLSAISTGLVDMVLEPDQIPEQLIAYVKRSSGPEGQPATRVQSGLAGQLQSIFALLREQTGHDFSGYKENTIVRRIERRINIKQMPEVEDYLAFLRQSPVEVDILFRELLIGVTNFFRDAQAFEALEEKVIVPLLAKPQRRPRQIRVWVPGCSTGEEAYSVAILLHEQLEKRAQSAEIQIFATDIDQVAIAKARDGRYPDNIAADVSPERLQRFFTRDANSNHFVVKRQIRDSVVFAEQSVIKDPPFSKMDLICCRNLMIYLEPDLQQRLLSVFHYALNAEGYLFLGNSESLGNAQKLFQTLDPKWKLYKRTEFTSNLRKVLEFTRDVLPKTRSVGAASETPLNARELTEKLLLEDYAPTTILVNEKGEMLYIHGNTGKYLEQSTGEASTNILRTAREGLRMALSTAMRNASTHKARQIVEDVSVKNEGGILHIKLTVSPVLKPRYSRGLLLVTFVELPPSEIADKQLELESSDDFQAQRVAELEHELKATGDYLQTVIEELETTNEELKASNEELQSANEELQSTNEELQTSKEELQSTNEELITVNAELQARVEDLTIANNDIKNLMESTRVGIIFLDENLRIRRFTDASRDMIDLIPEDVGRPLKNFVHKLPNLDLMPLVRLVVAQQQTVTREVQGENNLWYLLRIMPYLTVDEQVKGVVLTLTDVTELKQSEGRLQAAVAISGVGVYQHNVPIGPELYHSERWAEMLGYSKSELPAYGEFMDWLVTLLHPDDIAKLDKAYSDFIEGRTEQYEVEVRMQHKLGHWVYVQGLSQALARDAKGWVTEVIGVTLDVTAFRQVEAALRQLSQQRYRELFTNSIVSILLTDSAGEILHANPAACELFGYSEAELLSGRRELIINPDDSRFPKLLADRNRNGRTQGEMSFVRKDGTKFEAEIASALFTTPNGELQASVFIQDITERKQAEETLRFQARLLDAVQQAVIATNNNAEVVYWNPFAEKLYGWSAEEAIGKTTMELISIEDSASLNQEILKSVLEGESWSGEYVARNRAEQQLPIHTTLSPLYSENNELSGIIGISADITDRKQAEEALRESEQRLRELITNSMVGIILARDNGEILFANPAACHMLGYTEAELRAGGRGLIVDPRDKHIVELLSQRERDGRARGEVVLLKRDGTAVDVDLVSVLFTTLDGDKQASVFFQNITERKHAEAELLQARKLESLGVLAGGIAHDFNNLMTALLAHVELAAFSLTPDHPAYEHLVKAGLAREKATNLARQLLTFAKGGAPLKEINDISQLIAEATAFSMHGSSSKLNMIVAPNLWLAEVDRGQITQVLSNLIINARQAMPEGGTITVRATNEEIDAQHWVQIAVQDEGSGITPEHLERIFDPYFSTKADHSGLGLATAHSIITKHQGHITATSQVAEGATFTILLPADPQATLANVEPLPVRERVTSSKPARILGMDDELGIREALEVALGELGYQVSVCEDGESAVAAYRAALEAGRPYDAVILDLTIPGGVSGEAAAQEILKLDPKAKLIVSSGYANAPVMANFMDYGFSARMQKPYDLNTLEYTLSEVLAASGE